MWGRHGELISSFIGHLCNRSCELVVARSHICQAIQPSDCLASGVVHVRHPIMNTFGGQRAELGVTKQCLLLEDPAM